MVDNDDIIPLDRERLRAQFTAAFPESRAAIASICDAFSSAPTEERGQMRFLPLNPPVTLGDTPIAGTLHCPRCNGYNLHHGSVEVFTRAKEEGPSNAVLLPLNDETILIRDNPSSRRDGLLIHFYCEQCDDDGREGSVLEIFQHKGCTFLQWRR